MEITHQLIFLHGAGETPSSWDGVIRQLDTSYNTMAPAIFLDSDFAGVWDIDAVTDRIAATLPPQAHIVGLSLGAVIGLNLAIRHPHLTASLFLSAPQARPPRNLMRAQSAIMRLLPAKLITPPGLTKTQLLNVLHAASQINYEPHLPHIAAPTTITCGTKDKANLPAARRIASLIPNANLITIPDAGHQWHTAMPTQFAQTLTQHLRSL